MNKEEIREMINQQFIENIMTNLDSSVIFTYISNLEKENKQLKDNWNKLKEYIEHKYHSNKNLSFYGVETLRQNLNEIYVKMNKLEKGGVDNE